MQCGHEAIAFKRVCDFLLVRRRNLGSILPRFRDIACFLLRNCRQILSLVAVAVIGKNVYIAI